jgi:autotransporter passenger strand-loop-strand repeat protein
MPSATISGFSAGDIIDLASVASASGGIAVLTSSNVLEVVEGGSTYVLNLDPAQNFSGTQFVLTSDGSGGTDVTVHNLVSVTSGTISTIPSGQTVNNVVVLSGGNLEVLSGGTSKDTTVSSGGMLVVSSGGLADPTTIYLGGSETVLFGGTDLGTLISGGSQFDYGLASESTIFSGAQIVEKW